LPNSAGAVCEGVNELEAPGTGRPVQNATIRVSTDSQNQRNVCESLSQREREPRSGGWGVQKRKHLNSCGTPHPARWRGPPSPVGKGICLNAFPNLDTKAWKRRGGRAATGG